MGLEEDCDEGRGRGCEEEEVVDEEGEGVAADGDVEVRV